MIKGIKKKRRRQKRRKKDDKSEKTKDKDDNTKDKTDFISSSNSKSKSNWQKKVDSLQISNEDFLKSPQNLIDKWQTDEEFARQRLEGNEPRYIYRVTKPEQISDLFGELNFEKLMCAKPKKQTFKVEVSKGRYFIIDYTWILTDVSAPVGKGLGNTLPGARLLLRRNDDSKLNPVSIKLIWRTVEETFFAVDYKDEKSPYNWLLAKMFFCLAESQVHKLGSFFTETMCVTEVFATCMYRCLPSMHPVYRLLEPYIGPSIYVNDYVRNFILPDYIKRGLSISTEGGEQIITNIYRSYNFTDKYFPTDLENRGVNDRSKLPSYPYRDLGGLMFDEIHGMAAAFVRHYYKTPDDIRKDRELFSFIQSLSEDGLIVGIPKCNKPSQLVSIVTHIIFTSCVQYSILSGSQYYYNGFIPNSPSILTLHPPRTTDNTTLDTIVKGLPDFNMTFNILCQTNLLSPNSTSTLLSHYQHINFKETEVLEILNNFRAQLKMMGSQMEEHNFSVASPTRLRGTWDI